MPAEIHKLARDTGNRRGNPLIDDFRDFMGNWHLWRDLPAFIIAGVVMIIADACHADQFLTTMSGLAALALVFFGMRAFRRRRAAASASSQSTRAEGQASNAETMMVPNQTGKERPDWDAYVASSLAVAIRRGIGELSDPPRGGAFASYNAFWEEIDGFDPPLFLSENGEDISNGGLRVAFAYAQSFFWDWDEGLWTHGRLSWEDARDALESVLTSLDSGSEMADERVLSYVRQVFRIQP